MACRNAGPKCIACMKSGAICLKDHGSQSELCTGVVNPVIEAIDAYEEVDAEPSRDAELLPLEEEYKNNMKAPVDLERAAAGAAQTINLPIRPAAPAGASIPAGPSAATQGNINPRVVAAVQQRMNEFESLMLAKMNTEMELTRTAMFNQIESTRALIATQMELHRTEMELQRGKIAERLLELQRIEMGSQRGEFIEQWLEELQPKQIKDEDEDA